MIETVVIVAITGGVAVIALISKLIYSSKCSTVECCYGACKCNRKVEIEQRASEVENK